MSRYKKLRKLAEKYLVRFACVIWLIAFPVIALKLINFIIDMRLTTHGLIKY